MKISRAWKYHIILFSILVIITLLQDLTFGGVEGLRRNFSHNIFLGSLFYYVTSIIIYFVNFKIVSPRFLGLGNVKRFILPAIVLLFLFAGLRFLMQEIVMRSIFGFGNYNLDKFTVSTYLADNVYFGIRPVLYSTIVYLLLNNLERKEKNFQLLLDKRKAELRALKSQISPHFLFNTLNSFYVELIDEQPKTAENIQRLSQLLRYVIDQSKEDFVALENELTLIENYVHLYKMRYEDALQMELKIQHITEPIKVPYLVLLHFVENVFKHGNVTDETFPVKISLFKTNNQLVLRTENKIGSEIKHQTESGIGYNNVIRRLDALYGEKSYTLSRTVENDVYKSELKLPI